MAQTYPVLTTQGNAVLPTANGTFYTGEMSADHEVAQVYVEFFSDSNGKIPAAASSGTIAVSGSPMGGVYLAPSNLTTINAAEVYTGAYTPAEMDGCVVKGKVTFTDIAGAAYARVTFWRA